MNSTGELCTVWIRLSFCFIANFPFVNFIYTNLHPGVLRKKYLLSPYDTPFIYSGHPSFFLFFSIFSVFQCFFLKGTSFNPLYHFGYYLLHFFQLIKSIIKFSNVYFLTAQYAICWHIKGTTELTVLFSFHSLMFSSMEFVFFTVDAHFVSIFIFVIPQIFFLITVRLFISVLVKLNVLSFPSVYHFILIKLKSIYHWVSWVFLLNNFGFNNCIWIAQYCLQNWSTYYSSLTQNYWSPHKSLRIPLVIFSYCDNCSKGIIRNGTFPVNLRIFNLRFSGKWCLIICARWRMFSMYIKWSGMSNIGFLPYQNVVCINRIPGLFMERLHKQETLPFS